MNRQSGTSECKGVKGNIDVDIGSSILRSKEMIMQQLGSEPTGKAMKYQKVGPQEFVDFEYEEVSIENIKLACSKHFNSTLPAGMVCDILASQNGPSCTKLSHLSNFKTVYVRFIKGKAYDSVFKLPSLASKSIDSRILLRPPFHSMKLIPPSLAGSITSHQHKQPDRKSYPEKDTESTRVYAKGISVSTMLRLRKLVSNVEKLPELVEVSEFNIHNMTWSAPKHLSFIIEDNPFAEDGFRHVFKAKENGKDCVIKKFFESTMDNMKELNSNLVIKESVETLARKSIQMHMLALNFAEQLKESISGNEKQNFCETFSYKRTKLGRIIKTNEFVTIEDFIQGDFEKYINNDGTVSSNNSASDRVLKAECLAHSSYQKLNHELMLLDIQGVGYQLYHAESATATGLCSDDCELRFCMGNLATEACSLFLTFHVCNKYCGICGLQKNEPEL